MNKKVSIIIPTFGDPIGLDRAINSINNQSYQNCEMIVVDDNEPNTIYREKTKKIISNYNNIKYIMHEKNMNGAVARNTGIRVSSGFFISFLDADDYYEKDRIEKMVRFLEEHKEYFGVISNVKYIKNNKVIKELKLKELSDEDRLDILIHRNQLGTGSNLFFRNELLNDNLLFDEKFTRFQDIEFILNVLKDKKIGYIDDYLVNKTVDKTTNPKIQKVIVAFHMLNKKYNDLLILMDSKVRKKYFRDTYNVNLQILLSNQEFKDAIWYSKNIYPLHKWSLDNKLKLLFFPIYRFLKKLKKVVMK